MSKLTKTKLMSLTDELKDRLKAIEGLLDLLEEIVKAGNLYDESSNSGETYRDKIKRLQAIVDNLRDNIKKCEDGAARLPDDPVGPAFLERN